MYLPYKIALDGGTHYSGSDLTMDGCNRQLGNFNKTEYIAYILTDSSGNEWGDKCLSSPDTKCIEIIPFGGNIDHTPDCVKSTGTGSAQTFVIKGEVGKIFSDTPPGTYTDEITVTVLY